MSARLLSSFSSSGASFAVLSHDQRIKLFSTLTQQLTQDLTPANHLANAVTALALPAAASARTTSPTGPAAQLIALGTKQGDILLWHTAKGALEQTLGGAHKHVGAVSSLAFSPNGQFLFSCGAAERSVKQWNVSNGAFVASFEAGEDATAASGATLRHVAVSPDGQLLLAGGSGSLLLWHLSTPSVPARDFQGPTDRISCVAFSPDSRYAVSGTSADRYLSLWSTDLAAGEEATANGAGAEGQKKKKNKHKKQAERNTPLHTFTLQTAPISAQFNTHASKGVYQIAALSDSSIVSILQWSPADAAASSAGAAAAAAASSSSTPVSVVSVPHATSQSEAAKRRDESHKSSKHKNKVGGTAASSTLLAGDEGDAIGAGTVQALHFSTAHSLMVARGDAVRPLFQQVVFQREDGSFEREMVLPKYTHAHLMSQAAAADAAAAGKKRKGGNNEAVTIGAAHMADMTTQARSGLDGAAEEEEEAHAKKRAKLATSKSKSDSLSRSLAERLADSEAEAAAAQAAGVSAFNLETGALPKAGSLQTILQQALHSNDAALVEYCLTAGATAALQGNAALIRVTVRRLSPVYVLPLLQHLMSKFSSRPNRAASLLPWLREVFRAHTAYLIRQPSLSSQLAPLTHLLEQRSAVFKKMLKLQARLDLLLGQIAHTHASAADDEAELDALAAAEGAAGTGQALNTYNDGEDEDEDGEGEEEEDDLDEEDEDLEDAEDDDDEGEGEEDDDEGMDDEEDEE